MMENRINSYRDLHVWQRAMDLVECIYELASRFPKEEIYGLTSQMKRAAVSIPSNIAEGSRRGTRRDFRQFLIMAYGSGAELETHIEIAKRLKFIDNEASEKAELELSVVMKMLNRFISSLTD